MILVLEFLSNFWRPFIEGVAVVSILEFVYRSGQNPRMYFLRARVPAEIAGMDALVRNNILRDASAQALRRWQSLLPSLVIATTFATAVAGDDVISSLGSEGGAQQTSLTWAITIVAMGSWLTLTIAQKQFQTALRAVLPNYIKAV